MDPVQPAHGAPPPATQVLGFHPRIHPRADVRRVCTRVHDGPQPKTPAADLTAAAELPRRCFREAERWMASPQYGWRPAKSLAMVAVTPRTTVGLVVMIPTLRSSLVMAVVKLLLPT